MSGIESSGNADERARILSKAEELVERLGKLGISLQRLEELLDSLEAASKEPSKLRYYAAALTKLKRLEKEFGKSIGSLLREYEKKARELVSLEYSIDELRKKRKRIEEDLGVYMQQSKLTLDMIGRVNSILLALKSNGLELDDLEGLVSLVSTVKDVGKPEKVIEQLKRINDLNRELEDLNKKLMQTKLELESAASERDRLLNECSKLLNVNAEASEIISALNELKAEKETLQAKVEEIKRLRDSLLKEYSTLLDVKETVEDIMSEMGRKENKLKQLDEEISKMEKLLLELEEEVNAARALTMLLTEPGSCQPDEIQALIQQLNNILKIKQGELSVLRPLEGHLLEKARRRLVELVMPALSNEMVPKWVFERLEKQFESLVEKRAKLEEELQTLKGLLKQQQVEPEKKAMPPPEEPSFFVISGEGVRVPAKPEGKKARVICKHCKAGTLVWLPSLEELDHLHAKGKSLELKCSSCGMVNTINPAAILKLYQSQR